MTEHRTDRREWYEVGLVTGTQVLTISGPGYEARYEVYSEGEL